MLLSSEAFVTDRDFRLLNLHILEVLFDLSRRNM
jgi:hypothetical protein